MGYPSYIWPKEAVQRALALDANGATGSEIAAVLKSELNISFSRNAVIGKLHRLRGSKHLPAKVKSPPAARRVAAKVSPDKTGAIVSHKIVCDAIEPANNGKGYTIHEIRGCRWEVSGDPLVVNYRFCGRDVEPGYSFCVKHRAIAYTKPVILPKKHGIRR
jgi:hypothetical protein